MQCIFPCISIPVYHCHSVRIPKQGRLANYKPSHLRNIRIIIILLMLTRTNHRPISLSLFKIALIRHNLFPACTTSLSQMSISPSAAGLKNVIFKVLEVPMSIQKPGCRIGQSVKPVTTSSIPADMPPWRPRDGLRYSGWTGQRKTARDVVGEVLETVTISRISSQGIKAFWTPLIRP